MNGILNNILRDSCMLSEKQISGAEWFPLKTGNLRDNAVYMEMTKAGYRIVFSEIKAPYIDYLEYGTGPHDIPKAFGYPLPFGTFGRFAGYFHPGSRIHVGFISKKSVDLALKCSLQVVKKYGKVISYD